MKLKLKLILAAALTLTAGAAVAYPYESEFKARGAYAPDYRDHRGYRDGYGYRSHRGYGDGYGDGRRYRSRGRHCWIERRHHRDVRVCD